MFKNLTCLILLFCSVSAARSQKRDTVIYYFKNYNGFEFKLIAKRVSTIDSADFFRMILPPDSGDTRPNIHEFYNNGVTKLIGKACTNDEAVLKFPETWFSDNVIRFYPDGKRKMITQYKDGRKNGYEHTYYPNGKLYTRVKNEHTKTTARPRHFMLDCYDANGKQICENGNGTWYLYDDDVKNKMLEGLVVNGLPEGTWSGETITAIGDSIKYAYKYEEGKFVGGEGFDKSGTAYSFTEEATMASYKLGLFAFVDLLKRKASSLKDIRSESLSLKDLKVSFIIEKDGNISHPEIIGNLDKAMKEKLVAVLLSFNPAKWQPSRYFGVPLKTKMTVPFDYNTKIGNRKQIYFEETVEGL